LPGALIIHLPPIEVFPLQQWKGDFRTVVLNIPNKKNNFMLVALQKMWSDKFKV